MHACMQVHTQHTNTHIHTHTLTHTPLYVLQKKLGTETLFSLFVMFIMLSP